jgi:hypothetical protein
MSVSFSCDCAEDRHPDQIDLLSVGQSRMWFGSVGVWHLEAHFHVSRVCAQCADSTIAMASVAPRRRGGTNAVHSIANSDFRKILDARNDEKIKARQ